MSREPITRRRFWTAAAISGAIVFLMAWIRFEEYPRSVVPLAFAIPLLLGLWHRDRRIHWGMALAFMVIATVRHLFVMGREEQASRWIFWSMQMANVLIAAIVVHAVNNLRSRLEREREALVQTNAELEASYQEVTAREEEIANQNEELRQQAEELEQQTEELQQQAEELESQSSHLRNLNAELAAKESALRALLEASGPFSNEDEALRRICELAPDVTGASAAAAVLELTDQGMRVRACFGFDSDAAGKVLPEERTVAALVLERGETAFLEDLDLRADLEFPASIGGRRVRSVLSTPMKVSGAFQGALQVYGTEPHQWAAPQVRLLEWMAEQCSRVWEIVKLRRQRVQAEEELRRMNERLEDRVAERTALAESRANRLREMAVALTRAELQERRRLAKLLHDHLQQLLVAAKLQATALRRPDASESVRETSDLVDDLLRQAIETSRTLTVELNPANLHESGLQAGLEWLARWMLQKHKLHVELSLQPGADSPNEDLRSLLFEAIRELLFNVVKHAGTDRARVSVRCDERGWIFAEVADSGRGWEAGEKPVSALSGLGLFAIEERVEMMRGEFRVWSEVGRGTRVTLGLPPSPASDAPETGVRGVDVAGAEDLRPVSPSRTTPRSGKVRVLLVDDHAVVRQGLTAVLNTDTGITIVGEAADGEQAVLEARRLRPDVIVMDISMPRMDGIEATRRIVREMPAVQVIGLSMYEQADRAAAIRDAGACAFLSKDSAPEALTSAIRDAAAGRPAGTTPSSTQPRQDRDTAAHGRAGTI
jgi:signal transduction histidine kinase/FixJ family two-component response regulator